MRIPLVLLLSACKPDVFLPDPSGVTFVDGVDNPLFPLPPGATWSYEAPGDAGLEEIAIAVDPETRVVNGVTAVVVHDTVTIDGVILEDTDDWYAQDTEGNVWYLGEDTCEFTDGVCTSHTGAWAWGVDGAEPGWAMPAVPTADGRPYRQEFLTGVAEDVGEVIAIDVALEVSGVAYTGCVTTHDTSTLDPELDEQKTYCPGVGMVQAVEPNTTEILRTHTAP